MHARRWLAALALVLAGTLPALADDWPQWLGPRRDSVWREDGVVKTFPKDGPPVRWRKPVAEGYAGPAVADGRVYVHDFEPAAKRNVDSGMRVKSPGKERVLCFDAASGKELWKHEYDCPYDIGYPAGPRCTPTVAGGKVYALGAMGDLLCLDAKTGKVAWSKNLPAEYKTTVPLWGYAGHPLVDGNRLYCLAGGEGSTAVCLDRDTGKELWRALSAKQIGYSAPTLIQAGGKRQLLIWDGEAINGLDPESGKAYWSEPLTPNFGMAIMTPRLEGNLLFVAAIGNQAKVIKLTADKPGAEVVWTGVPRNALYPINSTPFVEDGHIYGVDQDGSLRCVKLADGTRVWSTFAPVAGETAKSGTAFLVKHADRFFLFNEKGELVIARLSPKGYEEVSRATILEPTSRAFGRDVVWMHPAFANRCVYARNDREIVCVSLEEGRK